MRFQWWIPNLLRMLDWLHLRIWLVSYYNRIFHGSAQRFDRLLQPPIRGCDLGEAVGQWWYGHENWRFVKWLYIYSPEMSRVCCKRLLIHSLWQCTVIWSLMWGIYSVVGRTCSTVEIRPANDAHNSPTNPRCSIDSIAESSMRPYHQSSPMIAVIHCVQFLLRDFHRFLVSPSRIFSCDVMTS